MKIHNGYLKLVGGIVVMAAVLMAVVPNVQAYDTDIYTGKRTYFEGVYARIENDVYKASDKNGNTAFGYNLIFNGGSSSNYTESGSYSPGYVMPNKQSTYANASSNLGGAIGMNALNSYSSNVDGVNRGNKGRLYNLLVGKNTGGTAWEKRGSALVVYQMIGKPKVTRGWNDISSQVAVKASDWVELKNRLVLNDDIDMVYNNSYTVYDPDATDGTNQNTAGITYTSGGTRYIDMADILLVGYGGSTGEEPAWEFRQASQSNAVVYALEVNCANPIGSFGGLPDYVPDSDEYELKPSANSNGVSAVEPGGEIQVDGIVENTGTDASPGNEWRLIEAVYNPGVTPGVGGSENAAEPCTNLTPANPTCKEVASGTGKVFPAGEETLVEDNYRYPVPETVEVGTRICFAVSVKPFSHLPGDQARWRHSSLHCVIVAKSPKFQVWGGDVRSGGKIDTSTRTFTSPALTFGSWGEYGVLSKKNNSGFASGSGLNNGNPASGQSSWDMLTFANTGVAPLGCSFGCYNFALTSETIASQFASGAGANPLGGVATNLNNFDGVYTAAGNVNITVSTISSGRSIIILADGTVTIQGDIVYDDNGLTDGGYTSSGDIPQVVIRAPSIRIQGNVGRVDAWLLAVNDTDSGTLYTCYGGAGGVTSADNLTSNKCNTPLTVNGPVIADTVYLWRTAGSASQESERGDPAEIFNLRADAYLWAHSYGSDRGRIQTVYTRELSPRF